jgi:hypothetical protein
VSVFPTAGIILFFSLTKALKIYDGEKTASSTKTAGKTG